VGDPEAVAAAVERFGHADLVAACARAGGEDVEVLTRVNWLGTVHTVSAALPGMRLRAQGHAVVVCGVARSPAESGTEAARRAFAETLRDELAGTAISATVVHAGEDVPAHRVADRLIRAVERDEREVFCPPGLRIRRLAPARRG
jgi:NADP-dependent 3-hydroxy acid dehydrogenase YdfG